MSADKRTVSTDALETLGTIIDENQKRDAIHLAVLPAIAGERLRPGESIAIGNGTAFADLAGIGIVDPFLAGSVDKGQRFWMVLRPRLITSLRHVWTHPDIPEELGAAGHDRGETVAAAEGWLRAYCARLDIPGYEELMGLIAKMTEGREELVFGTDAYGELTDEFWDKVEIVIGRQFKDRPMWISCAC